MGTRSFMSAVRKWSRPVHRDLSFFFSGVLLIYAVSGFMLNHKRDFNSDYSVRRTELVFAQEIPRAEQEWTRARAEELLLRVGEEGNYLKHYFPEPDRFPLNKTSPSVLLYNPIQVRPHVVFPHPDSPTMPSVSPL